MQTVRTKQAQLLPCASCLNKTAYNGLLFFSYVKLWTAKPNETNQCKTQLCWAQKASGSERGTSRKCTWYQATPHSALLLVVWHATYTHHYGCTCKHTTAAFTFAIFPNSKQLWSKVWYKQFTGWRSDQAMNGLCGDCKCEQVSLMLHRTWNTKYHAMQNMEYKVCYAVHGIQCIMLCRTWNMKYHATQNMEYKVSC